LDSRHNNFENTRVRGLLTVDARSQTEYGTLRSYIAGGWQETNNDWTGNATYAPRAFVQWAGFTAGRATSFFDFYSTPAYSNTTNVLGSDTGGQGDTVFAYTAQFGNGLSATISAEDQTQRATAIALSTSGGPISAAPGYAGRVWPDIAANLRIDQAWGSAQVMGAAHQVKVDSDVNGSDEVGWAVGAGLTVNLPMLGAGDSLSTQFTYSKGAMNYVGSGLTTFAITSNATTAYGPVFDAVVVGNGLELTTGWSIVGGYEHRWNPNWKTSLYGDYGKVTYSNSASAVLAPGGNPDWAFWQAGSRTVWTPVANLDLSVDVMYNKVETGSPFLSAPSTNVAESKGWWQGMFRVQRNFYP
jgi:hypothetical protein